MFFTILEWIISGVVVVYVIVPVIITWVVIPIISIWVLADEAIKKRREK